MLQQAANKVRRLPPWLILMLLLLFLIASLSTCTLATPLWDRTALDVKALQGEPTISTRQSNILTGLKLTPVYVEAQPGDDGWTDYRVMLALQNATDQLLYLPGYLSGQAIIETAGGATYEGQFAVPPGASYIVLPPRFRILGIVNQDGERQPIALSFRAPTSTDVLRARMEDAEVIQLKPAQMIFPTDSPPTAFYNQGEAVPLLKNVSVAIGQSIWENDQSGFKLVVPLTFQTVDQRREDPLKLKCFIVDGWGYLYVGKVDKPGLALQSEPGQTAEYSLVFGFGDNKGSLTNAKLICRGEEPNQAWVFNLPSP